MAASTGITITLGKTSKRINSTSTSFSGTAYTGCFLKENCSINNPVIILNAPLDKYNYMSWGSRYYWVDETISIDWNRIEVHAHLDPLATYKSSITGSSVYALYANSSYWNEYVDDIRIQPEKLLYQYSDVKNQVFGNSVLSSTGCVVMTFFQAIPSAGCNPGIHTGVLSISSFRECLKDLSSIQWDQGVTEFLELFTKTIQAFAGNGSWCDNVYSCIWIPVDIGQINGTGRNGIAIGGLLADNVSWKEIPQNYMIKNDSSSNQISLAGYWSTLSTGGKAFLRQSRFSSAQLVTPSGAVSVDMSTLMQVDHLQISAVLNVGNGDWCLEVHNTNMTGEVLATASGNLGINLMGLVVDSPDLISQGAQTVFNAALGGAAVAVASEYGAKTGVDPSNIIASPIVHNAPSCPLNSSGPGMFVSPNPGRVMFVVTTMGPEMIQQNEYISFCGKHGYPANRYISLSGYSGFLKCFNASVGCNGASQAEEAFVNTCLNSGIYIE